MNLTEKGFSRYQILLAAALCLFSLITMVYKLVTGGVLFDVFYCLATLPFVCLPLILSAIFKWRFNNIFFTVFALYALGPLLGAVYKLYYVTEWWDDVLHILAGTLFAVCGGQLTHVLNRGNKSSILLCALFGVCFSMGIAVLWEIFEYAADVLLKSDMQSDAIVTTIATKLGRSDGGVNIYSHITDVTVNGQALGMGGYVGSGLVDTMSDMTVETGGALAYLVYVLIDRDRHPLIRSCRKEEV